MFEQNAALAPRQDHQPADEHTAQVGEMRDAGGEARHTGEELDGGEDRDHPLGAECHGREEQGHPGLGEEHRVAHQHAVDGTGGAHCRGVLDHGDVLERGGVAQRSPFHVGLHLQVFHAEVQGHGPQAADKVEEQELLAPDDAFDHAAEDQQRVHVEEDVPEPAVHEHVRDHLPPVEIRGGGVEQGEGPDHEVLVEEGGQEHDHVDDDQVLGHGRQRGEESSPATAVVAVVIVCHLKILIYVPEGDDADDAPPVRGEFGVVACKKRVNEPLRVLRGGRRIGVGGPQGGEFLRQTLLEHLRQGFAFL